MATTTVTEIIERAKSAADKTNSNHVTQIELLRWLNVENHKLATFIARAGYVLQQGREDITANGASEYSITDPICILGVYQLEAGRYRRLRQSDFQDGAGRIDTVTTGDATVYRVYQNSSNQTTLEFYPKPSSGTYQVFTVPQPATLTISSSVSYPMGWEEYLVLGLAKRMLAKEETINPALEREYDDIGRHIERAAWDRVLAGNQAVRNVDKVERGWTRLPQIPSREHWLWI